MPRLPLKRVLYLGLEAPKGPKADEQVFHLPLIKIIPRLPSDAAVREFYRQLPSYTHAVFTSKSAVRIFFNYLPHFNLTGEALNKLKIAAVGKATAGLLKEKGAQVEWVAKLETSEGLCDLLKNEAQANTYFCWPHSLLSRPVLLDFFKRNPCQYYACVFYETHYEKPEQYPSLEEVDEIIFTSPSTIRAFLQLYGKIPWDKSLVTIGPVTEKQLFLLRD